MQRTVHVHILDTGEGDWGTHATAARATAAARKALKDFNSFADVPMTQAELTIISSEHWCALDPDPCYHDQRQALLASMRTTPLWTHDFPSPPSAIYRIAGKRVPRWKMACSMSIDQAMTLWPFTGHPVALPIWRYETIIADSDLCPCTTRSHRKAGCIIGPAGLKCSICGALHQDYGNISHHCLPCQDWLERRELHLADWAAEATNSANLSAQLVLL